MGYCQQFSYSFLLFQPFLFSFLSSKLRTQLRSRAKIRGDAVYNKRNHFSWDPRDQSKAQHKKNTFDNASRRCRYLLPSFYLVCIFVFASTITSANELQLGRFFLFLIFLHFFPLNDLSDSLVVWVFSVEKPTKLN